MRASVSSNVLFVMGIPGQSFSAALRNSARSSEDMRQPTCRTRFFIVLASVNQRNEGIQFSPNGAHPVEGDTSTGGKQTARYGSQKPQRA